MIKLNRRRVLSPSSPTYSTDVNNNTLTNGGLGSAKSQSSSTSIDRPNNRYVSESAGPNSMPTGYNNTSMTTLPITVDLGTLLDGIGHDAFSISSERMLYPLYRDMYYYDCVAGSAVDMQSNLPFSEFSLGGINDTKVLDVYHHTLERLNVRTLLPEMSVDYQVLGSFIASLLYDKASKTFTDVMPHPIENVTIVSLPFYSQAPIIEVRFPQELIKLISDTKSPRIQSLRDKFGEEVITKIKSGLLELDPLSTIYLPRRSFSHTEGTSYYKRILPIYLLEKNLFRGTLLESARRQRGIMHLTVGDGDSWEPSASDLDYISELFSGASADPLGAIIATRLGVSAEEVMCIRGNTLVSTPNSMIKIADIVPHDPEQFKGQRCAVPIDIEVKGLNGDFVKADIWMYQGYKDIYRLTTESGSSADGTENHRYLVLDDTGDLIKVKAKDLLPNNYSIACDTQGYCTMAELPLDLKDLPYDPHKCGGKVKKFIKPKVMTTELAYTLGIVLSDGNIRDNDGRVSVCNTSLEILHHFQHCMQKVFGDGGFLRLDRPLTNAPTNRYLNGCKLIQNYDIYEVVIHGNQLVDWFSQLGMVLSTDVKTGTSACLEYVVPHIMFEANRECKIAFLAGFTDGDGCVKVKKDCAGQSVEIVLCSGSNKLLNGLKVMLSDMGYGCKLRRPQLYIAPSDACGLYNEMVKYIQSPGKKPFAVCDVPVSRKNAIPAMFVSKLIRSRYVRQADRSSGGSWYENDDGDYVLVTYVNKYFHDLHEPTAKFSYSAYDNGTYDNALSVLKQISLSTYNKLITLLKLQLRFEKVISYEYLCKDHVYDLSIKQPDFPTVFKDGKAYRRKVDTDKYPDKKYLPTFYAVNGGILSSNSPNDMWKWTDIIEQTSGMKYKALGITEALLTGEATLNTMDNSLTMFIDHLRQYRDMITRKLFYNSIFPLISVINGYTVTAKGRVITGDTLLQKSMEDTLSIMQDGSKLLIPTIHWAKQLKPEGDSAYFDILERLTQAGVPVPLRVIAAAGGFNIHDLLSQKDDDLANRDQVGVYLKQLAEKAKKYATAPPPDESGDGQDADSQNFAGFASAGESLSNKKANLLKNLSSTADVSAFKSTVLASKHHRPSLQDRFKNVDPEIVGRTRTGKKKVIHNQVQANSKANGLIIKAVRNHVKYGSSQLNNDTTTEFKKDR